MFFLGENVWEGEVNGEFAAAVVAVITRISGVVFANSLMASDSAAPTSGPTAVRLPIAFGQGNVDVMSKNEVIGSP